MKFPTRPFLGWLLIGAGVLLLIDSAGLFNLGWLLRVWWPILLVIAGLWLLFRRGRRGFRIPGTGAPTHSGVFGDVVLNITQPAFSGATISNVFGDVDVDLRSTSPAEGEHQLSISGTFGDVEVLLPPGMHIRVSAHTFLGEVTVADRHQEGLGSRVVYESDGYAAAARRLDIRITVVVGDIEVR